MKPPNAHAKILIIDDEAEVRSAVRLTLEEEQNANYSFTEASNVASGLKALKAKKPDVVILDLLMPGPSGYDFIQTMKKDHSMPLTRIIILTAHDSMKNLWKAENTGVNAYHFMSKPFVGDDLRATVLGLVLL
ncbi:MAG TPA: response regulator [Candidatus Saccharimonadales bacterium]|nr:response regulator [Candidatus Saccharimonadales bacterium]